MRRRLISTIRERRPRKCCKKNFNKTNAMFNLFNLFSLVQLLLFFVPQQKVVQCSCYTALHYTALSTYFTLCRFFFGFIPFWALLLTSPSSTLFLLSASPQRGSCGMLGICFALCLTFCSYATPLRLPLPQSDAPRAASFSFPLPFSLSLSLSLSVCFLDVSAPYFFHFCIIKGRN